MPGGGSLHPTTHETVDQKMHYVHQDGQAVFKFAVRKMAELCEKILERNGIKGTDIDVFIPHQANKRIITATADRLGLRPRVSSSISTATATPRRGPFRWPWRPPARKAS